MTSDNVTETEPVKASEPQLAKKVDDQLIDELVGRAQAEVLQQTGEGAKHWMHIPTEIKNRGVNDVHMPRRSTTVMQSAPTGTSSERPTTGGRQFS